RPAAARMGVELLELPAKDAEELREVLKRKAVNINSRTDAIVIIVEPFSGLPEGFAAMADFAKRHSIPIGGIMYRDRIDDSLFGYIPLNVPVGKQSAFLADKVLKGIPAGSLPVVSAESHFTFNYRAARKLGLNVSEGMLSRANEVIR
ncbi:MAG: hypothetical protein JXA66_01905, partial [Oligoflexia bacterium]|nr:hypothetical protein [Oligoflexia bacterium]